MSIPSTLALCSAAIARAPGRRGVGPPCNGGVAAWIAAASLIRALRSCGPTNRPASISKIICPKPGWAAGSRWVSGISDNIAAPARPAAKRSRLTARAAPLGPPIACINPPIAALASVVGGPWASVAHVSGMGWSRMAASRTRERAATDSAISKITWPPFTSGMARPKGALPTRAARPPGGAIIGAVLVVMIAAKPSSAASHNSGASAPRWVARRMKLPARPVSRAACIVMRSADMATPAPKPASASISLSAGAGALILICAPAFIPPAAKRAT